MARIRSLGYGVAALALIAGAGVQADDAAEAKANGPTISGYVNGTYSYDLRNPAGQMTAGRVYDAKANTFRLDNAHVAITGGLGDVNYVIETDAGSDAVVNHSLGLSLDLTDTPTGDTVTVDPSGMGILDLQEAYVTFKDPFMKKMGIDVTVKAGKFVTFEGIEVIESGSNPTISRGYLFAIEPYTHLGVTFAHAFGPVTLTAGVLNGWDSIVDNNSPKTGVVNVFTNLGDAVGTLSLTGMSGAETTGPGSSGIKRNSVDATGLLKVLPKTDLWYQVNYRDEELSTGGSDKMGGAGIQPLIHLTDSVAIGIRLEYIETKEYGLPVVVGKNETLTLAWNFAKNITMRWEARHDDANMLAFEDSFGNRRKSTATIGTEFIVTF